MPTGAITGYFDIAQLALYGFWIFFAGLVYYLRTEDKREGYPLQAERRGNRVRVQGFPPIPRPKIFRLRHGGIQTAPRDEAPSGAGNASPTGPWPGAPLEPNGDPMRDGVGPAAYAMRAEEPDRTSDGHNRLAPLRLANTHYLDPEDTDPRGMAVVGADGEVGGIVRDIWVDKSEMVLRYLEVEVTTDGAPRRVLLPLNLARIHASSRKVRAASVLGRHFAHAPGLADPDRVTLREEDHIQAYYASGYLYATPQRGEPLL